MIKRSEHRKRKRLQTCLSMILAAMLLFTAAAVPSSADSGADSATTLLASMGIISADSSGNYNLSNTVSRAEFAKMLVMASSCKDLVDTSSKSSPYKDVPSGNWAAPYIKIAVSNGMMSGYSDGTFRPDATVTLEQGVNSALKLLGYTASDFTGSFPTAQMNVYYSNGLSKNISGGIGTLLSKGNAANLIYNMLSTKLKDGSKTYAESLGYSLNDSGAVDYASIISDNMYGPYTVTSSNWAGELGMNASALTIYKNGSLVNASDINTYDILYYSQSKGTVWVYDDKITGVYEDASPSQNAVTSVTVSGTAYPLESSAAFAALSSTGSLKIGTSVTLLLGKNGGVADAVAATKINASATVYVTDTGTKTYTNSNGKEYTSFYFKGIKPSGTEIEYTSTQTWVEPGDMLKISFDTNGNMSLGSAKAGGNIIGTADADLSLIGSTSIAANATILDTNLGNYAKTSLERLDGVKFVSGDVLYYEATGGKVTALVLNDVTGDTGSYGVVTSASSKETSSSVSGTYQYMIDGITQTLSAANTIYNVNAGAAAKFYGESGEISKINSLKPTGSKLKSFTSTELIIDDSVGVYPISANVVVYSKATGSYKLSTLSEAIAAYQNKTSVSFYYDKEPSRGGCIRVIVHN
ncbi:MAG: S-layer y protein [Bacillota bacterium]|nr:S-layer y protein [Bacillota bacterium]